MMKVTSRAEAASSIGSGVESMSRANASWNEVDQHISWTAENPEVPQERAGRYRRVNLTNRGYILESERAQKRMPNRTGTSCTSLSRDEMR
jgi:hypothetical protein